MVRRRRKTKTGSRRYRPGAISRFPTSIPNLTTARKRRRPRRRRKGVVRISTGAGIFSPAHLLTKRYLYNRFRRYRK